MALSFNGKEANKVCFNNNVGYKVVGNPSIVDGVASGFSNSDYLKITKNTYLYATKDFIVATAVIPNEIKTQSVFGMTNWYINGIQLNNDGKIQGTIHASSPTEKYYYVYSSVTYQVSKKYYLQLIKSGQTLTIRVSIDNVTFTEDSINLDGNDVIPMTNDYAVGIGPNAPFTGSIDLNETYIKVNGVTWFSGKEQANKDVNYVIKDGKLVWANPNLYLKSSGTQYINTKLVADGNTTYEIKLKRGEGVDSWFFGQDGGYSVNAHGIIYYENSGHWFYGNKGKGINLDKDTIYILKSETKDNKYIGTINSNPFLSYDISSFSSPGTFVLFGYFRGGVALSKELSIYYSKIFQNNNIIQHFVPVPAGLKIGNYTVPANGMWDIVTQQFFGNSGTGDFTIGRD